MKKRKKLNEIKNKIIIKGVKIEFKNIADEVRTAWEKSQYEDLLNIANNLIEDFSEFLSIEEKNELTEIKDNLTIKGVEIEFNNIVVEVEKAEEESQYEDLLNDKALIIYQIIT